MNKTVMMDMCATVQRNYFMSFTVDVNDDMPDDELETLVRAYITSGKSGFRWHESAIAEDELSDDEITACDIEDADDTDSADVTQAEMEAAIGGTA
jgi:hypothetical protein